MAQGFYTLEEAAQRLGMSTADLSGMAQRHEVRAFMDRNTWRFRAQDVDELARQRGVPSDPSVPAMPAVGTEDTGSNTEELSPFEIQDLTEVMTSPHEEEDIGVDLFASSVDDARRRTSDSGVILGAKSGLAPESATDSGILGSSVFGAPPKSGIKKPASSKIKPPSSKHPAPPPTVAKEDDSVVPIGRETLGGPADSAVRLDGLSGRLPDSGVRLVDFDDLPGLSGLVAPPSSSTRLAASSNKPPTVRSEPEVVSKLPPGMAEASLTTEGERRSPSSSEFEFGSSAEFDLTPSSGPAPSDSVFDLSTPSMESIELQVTSDLEDSSGSAIELEQVQSRGGSGATRSPAPDADASDDSVTFELTMEDESPARRSGRHKQPINSSFELSLEQPATSEPVSEQSDSDFELTLDDSSSSVEVDEKAPGATDDSESSDFELALDDDSISEVVDDTGSEVVVLDDDATKATPAVVETDDVVAEADDDEALAVVEAAEEAPVAVVPGKEITTIPADWGWWSLILVPTTLVMLFTGFLLFEMLRNTWSYSEPGPMSAPVFRMLQERTK